MKRIGIDTGTITGVARSEKGELVEVFSSTILNAFDYVLQHRDARFYIEDARKLKWGGYNKGNTQRLQGAGSVKRDAAIWEEFMEKHELDYVLVDPRRNRKKLDAKTFQRITGYMGRTNEHGRDAAMMVYSRRAA